MAFAFIFDIAAMAVSACHKWKEGPSKQDRAFAEARAATGKEQDALLAKFCEDCARRIQKRPRDAHTLHQWALALWWRAAKAPHGEDDQLYGLADKKFAQAQALAANDGEIRADRADALWRRAALHQDEEGRQILQDLCGHCERRVGIYSSGPHDARLFHVWGLALGALARRESNVTADRLYEAADDKLVRGLALVPGSREIAASRAETTLWRASLHTGERGRELLGRVIEQCAEIAGSGAAGAPILVTWGYALCRQAAELRSPQAAPVFAEAERKFTRALSVDAQSREASAGKVHARFGRALHLRGPERRALLAEVCDGCAAVTLADPQNTGVLELWGNALCWLAVSSGGPDADRLLMLAAEKFSAGLTTRPDDDRLLIGLALTLCYRIDFTDPDTAQQFVVRAAELLERVVSRNPANHEALNQWANVLAARARLIPGEETARMLAAAIDRFASATPTGHGSPHLFRGWGLALWAQAGCLAGEPAMLLLQQAKAKLREAEALAPGSAAYCLAGLSARAAEFEECRKWLEASGEPGITISRDAMKAEEAFARVRDCDWFRRLLATPEDRVQAERCAAVDFRHAGPS